MPGSVCVLEGCREAVDLYFMGTCQNDVWGVLWQEASKLLDRVDPLAACGCDEAEICCVVLYRAHVSVLSIKFGMKEYERWSRERMLRAFNEQLGVAIECIAWFTAHYYHGEEASYLELMQKVAESLEGKVCL